MAEWTTNLTFSENATFNTDFEAAETFETAMDQTVEVVTSDHTKLTNRDAAQQHPITSITGLSTELGNRVVSGNTLTNQDIEQIFTGG